MICKHDNAVCICGKGENDYCPIKPLTNEEWLCGLSTKEKAHELYRRCNYASIFGSPTAEEIEKWLKEVHKE